MQTDNVCRDPIDQEATANAVAYALLLRGDGVEQYVLKKLMEQGVLHHTEVEGATMVRALIVTTKAGDTIAVDEQGLVL